MVQLSAGCFADETAAEREEGEQQELADDVARRERILAHVRTLPTEGRLDVAAVAKACDVHVDDVRDALDSDLPEEGRLWPNS